MFGSLHFISCLHQHYFKDMCLNGYILYDNLFNQSCSFGEFISIILLLMNKSVKNIFVRNSDDVISLVRELDGSWRNKQPNIPVA